MTQRYFKNLNHNHNQNLRHKLSSDSTVYGSFDQKSLRYAR